jgi:hypothetical protein
VSWRRVGSTARLGATALVAAALSLAACGSGSVTPSPSQAIVGGSSPAAATAAEPSAIATATGGGPSASSGAAGGSAGTAVTLPANVCDILDVATIMSLTGLNVGAGVPVKGTSDEIGSCNWDATSATGVSVTAYPTAFIQQKLASMPPNFTVVPAVGKLAKGQLGGSGPLTTAVIFADLGSFGLRLAVHSPAATLDQAARLVEAVK